MRGLVAGALLFFALFGAGPAHAQLAVDRLWVDFEPGLPGRADVVIRNESNDKYYITVTPAEITDPGADTEKRVESTDPEKLGLLVTPNRLVLEPGAMRSIRIVSLNDDLKTDRVYRVKITPQVGDIQAPSSATGRGIAIKILAAYDILVTARPKKSKPSIEVSRQPGELVIRNSGNTNTLLYEGQECPDATASACAAVGARRLYPGNEWKIPLTSESAKVRFKQRSLASGDPKEISF
jgi:P pilus assembly chaperone PapD